MRIGQGIVYKKIIDAGIQFFDVIAIIQLIINRN